MNNNTPIEAALKNCHNLISQLEKRVERGNEHSLGAVWDRLHVLTEQLPGVLSAQFGSVGPRTTATWEPTSTSTPASTPTGGQVAANLTSEDLRRIRKETGKDTKYVGVKSADELWDLRERARVAKGQS